MRRIHLLSLFACLLALVLPLSAQNNTLPPVNPATVTGNVITSGSPNLGRLTQTLVDQFRTAGYTGNVVVDTSGTSSAFTRFCNAEIDIVLADRQITPEEFNNCANRGRTVVGFRVATDAVIIATNPQNDFLEDVNTAELALMFGTALTWSQVRQDWPDEPINRYLPSTNTSEYDFLSATLFANDTSAMRRALGAQPRPTDEELLASLQGDPFGITFFGVVFTNQNAASLKQLAVNGVGPNEASITTRNYTLSRPLLLYSAQELMQQQRHVADFINYYLSNVSVFVPTLGLYPAAPEALSVARDTWLSTMRDVLAQSQPQPLSPAETPLAPVVTAEPAPTAPPSAFSQDTTGILLDVRSDLELLALSRLGLTRPEGWSGSLDVNNPDLVIITRLDLELLANVLLNSVQRPAGWFGAIPSTAYALARDARHDLEVLADTVLGVNQRPEGWVGGNPIFRCNRGTQTLILLLERGGVFTFDLDPTTPNYCQLAEETASRFSEINLLTLAGDQAIFSPIARAAVPGTYTIDTEFGVGFLDRNAALRVGVVPNGEPVQPVARSVTQFSNMLLIEGQDFLVFVDYRDTTLTEAEFESLPSADEVTATRATFCNAAWCR